MAKPAYLIGSLIHDCAGPRLNADKAPWALGCAEELLVHLADYKSTYSPAGDNQAKAIKRILVRLRDHFATNGKSGMTQGTAKTKAMELKKLWTEILPDTLEN